MQKCTTIYGIPKAASVGRDRDFDEVHSNRMQTSVNPFHIRLEIQTPPHSIPLPHLNRGLFEILYTDARFADERGVHRRLDDMHKSNNETIIIQ